MSANIRFSQITKYARDTRRITFPSKSMANSAISNKILGEVGLVAFIPRFKFSRKVVIKEIPEDFRLDELKMIIEEENPNIMINDMFRLKRRNRTTRMLEESQVVCLEIRGKTLPEKVSILKAVIPVASYVSSVSLWPC